MSHPIGLANTISTTTIRSLRLKVNEIIDAVNEIGENEHIYLEVTNANAKFATKAYAASNTAVRLLINDRIQVANVAATYQTKAIERAALANTNSSIATKVNISTFNAALANTNAYIASISVSGGGANWSALTSTNSALRVLISDRLQVANAAALYQTKVIERAALANTNAYIRTKANWSSLTATNTALRTLISDRIQVANVAAKYATKSYAASNAYVKLLLANTNAYIADVAASSGGGGGGYSSEAVDYGLITSSADIDLNRDYGTL